MKMNDIIGDWFSGFGTPGGAAYVLTGFFLAYIFRWIRCQVTHETMKIPWHLVGIAIGTIAIVVTTVQSSVAYNTASATALETKECQKEFNQAIKDGRRIANENDELSQQQRRLFVDKDHEETLMWLNILSPPEPYASMDQRDPSRQDFNLSIVTKYSKRSFELDEQIRKIQETQDKLLASRPPLPEPTCGK